MTLIEHPLAPAIFVGLQGWMLLHGWVYARHRAPRRWWQLLLLEGLLQSLLTVPVLLYARGPQIDGPLRWLTLAAWTITALVTIYLLMADLIRVVSRVIRRTQHRDKSTSRRYAGTPAASEAPTPPPTGRMQLPPSLRVRPQLSARAARLRLRQREMGERWVRKLNVAAQAEIEQVTISVPRLPHAFEGLRVVHLTDFHAGEHLPEEQLAASVAWANSVEPDLVVLTGDFVTDTKAAIEPCAAALAGLTAPLGVWACLGNHDFWTDPDGVAAALEAVGIGVLRNRHVQLERNGQTLYLAGIDDIWLGADDLDRALDGIPTDAPVVLLAHNPDFLPKAEARGIDLMLSGHTHGGQIRVPLLGPIGIPTGLGKYYVAGLHRPGATTLYVSRGLGVVGVPVRVNCPPEFTHLTLTREAVHSGPWPQAWHNGWETLKTKRDAAREAARESVAGTMAPRYRAFADRHRLPVRWRVAGRNGRKKEGT